MLLDVAVILGIAAALLAIVFFTVLRVRDKQTQAKTDRQIKEAVHKLNEQHEYTILDNRNRSWTVYCKHCSWSTIAQSYAGAELEGELHAPTP